MAKHDKSAHPFQASEKQLLAHIDSFADATIESLASFYLELPRGGKFLEYEEFHKAYEGLLAATRGFAKLDRDAIAACVDENPRAFAVLRCILGISPPDLADMATERTDTEVQQGTARTIDQKARQGEKLFTDRRDSATNQRVRAMIEAACQAIEHYPGMEPKPLLIHRLEKVDTRHGTESLQEVAKNGVAYSELLYERLLGRPFASHRDSVSELVGDIVEAAVVNALSDANVPFYKTGRAEALVGFDQAPDFLIPDKDRPKAVIEAKLTQDDGTARDKVTRLQHLRQLSGAGRRFEVIACIDGRGFRIRREDMKKLLRATKGKVFTLATMDQLVKQTSLQKFAR